MENNAKIIITILTVLILLGGIFAFANLNKGYTEDEVSAKLREVVGPLNEQLSAKDIEINSLNAQIVSLEVVPTEVETEISNGFLGYLIDKLGIGEFISDIFSDREVKKLIDSKVEVNGKSYDFEETLTIEGVTAVINGDDYKENSYLNLLEDSVSYNVVFSNKLNVSKLDNEDNTLTFNFLGKEITITSWNKVDKEITLFEGKRVILNEGESVEVDGKTVVLSYVSDNNNVFVTVGSNSKMILEGQTKTIGGIQVRVENVLFNSVTPKLMATLVVGTDVEKTISDGDEFEEDSIFEYVIVDNSIGITLKESFTEIDEDEEFKAIGTGEKFCLPNEYVCLVFNGLVEEDYESYRFYLDDGFVVVKGNFQSGVRDFTKLFITSEGIYSDRDMNVDDLLTDVYFGDSEEELSSDEFSIFTGTGINFLLSLTDVEVNNVVVDGKEDNYRSIYGAIVESPESNLEREEVRLSIPMKAVEYTVSLL